MNQQKPHLQHLNQAIIKCLNAELSIKAPLSRMHKILPSYCDVFKSLLFGAGYFVSTIISIWPKCSILTCLVKWLINILDIRQPSPVDLIWWFGNTCTTIIISLGCCMLAMSQSECISMTRKLIKTFVFVYTSKQIYSVQLPVKVTKWNSYFSTQKKLGLLTFI